MKRTKNDSFTNCYIDKEKKAIVEFTKDGDKIVFPIDDIIEEWSDIQNLSITIKQTEVIE